MKRDPCTISRDTDLNYWGVICSRGIAFPSSSLAPITSSHTYISTNVTRSQGVAEGGAGLQEVVSKHI